MLEHTFGSVSFAGTLAENMGGARTWRFAPVQHFATLGPAVQGVVIVLPTWVGDEEWNDITPIEDSAQFSEDEERERGGPIYQNAFTCDMAGENIPKRMQYDSMVRVPVIAEVTDNNGLVRRMGELGDPAFITAKHSTGRGTAARNAWSLTIEWNSERPCPIVDATFVPTPPPEEVVDSGSIGDASGEFGGG